MKERNRFEQEMRALGIGSSRPEAGLQASRARPGIRGAERELSYEIAYELSDSLAKFKDEAKIPDEAIKKLFGSTSFRALASVIDKNYVSLDELMSSGQPTDMSNDGRLTKAKGKFKNKRVLVIQTGSATEFRPARTVDNLGAGDIIDIQPPSQANPTDTEKNWLRSILCMLAQARNQATAKRDKSASLSKRIKDRVGEQIVVRNLIDDILKEIDAKNAGYNIGILFKDDFKRLRHFIEIGYYPTDLLINGSFILTNLERCALLELMEESRRQQKLDNTAIDTLKNNVDTRLSNLKDDDLAKELQCIKLCYFEDAKHKGDFIVSDLETLLFARGVIHRRWRQFLFDPNNPVPLDSDTWKTNTDMKDRRQQHAAKIFPKSVKYLLDP